MSVGGNAALPASRTLRTLDMICKKLSTELLLPYSRVWRQGSAVQGGDTSRGWEAARPSLKRAGKHWQTVCTPRILHGKRMEAMFQCLELRLSVIHEKRVVM